jgi:hypothetical protein
MLSGAWDIAKMSNAMSSARSLKHSVVQHKNYATRRAPPNFTAMRCIEAVLKNYDKRGANKTKRPHRRTNSAQL